MRNAASTGKSNSGSTTGGAARPGDELRLDLVDLAAAPRLAGVRGTLRMTSLPGRSGDDSTGRWARDADVDAATLRAIGTDLLLLLVEDHELVDAGVPDLVYRLQAAGLDVLRHPVPDMGVPADRAGYRATLEDVLSRIGHGEHVVVACRAGFGRTGTAVACLLVQAGMKPETAIRLTRESRRGTIESAVQEAFVRRWPSTD